MKKLLLYLTLLCTQLHTMDLTPGAQIAQSEKELDKNSWMDIHSLLNKLKLAPDKNWCFVLEKLRQLAIPLAIKRSYGGFTASRVRYPLTVLSGTPGAGFSLDAEGDRYKFVAVEALYTEPKIIFVNFSCAPSEAFDEFKKEFNWDGTL